MVPGRERAANDVINNFSHVKFRVSQLFSMHLPKVHVSEFISQLVVSKLYRQSILSTKSQNETRTCSVLFWKEKKKRKPKNKQQNQIVVHGLSRNNNGLSSVIVFPESHRARNARHQFQQTKN